MAKVAAVVAAAAACEQQDRRRRLLVFVAARKPSRSDKGDGDEGDGWAMTLGCCLQQHGMRIGKLEGEVKDLKGEVKDLEHAG
jgi:hypothetical protein